jgi:hypothetical protein
MANHPPGRLGRQPPRHANKSGESQINDAAKEQVGRYRGPDRLENIFLVMRNAPVSRYPGIEAPSAFLDTGRLSLPIWSTDETDYFRVGDHPLGTTNVEGTN